MLRVQEFPFTKGKRALRGRGRGSESPPLHPLKNPHNPPERVLKRRTPVRLYLSPSARCAEGGALSQNLCFAFPIGIALSEMLRLPYRYRKVSDASRDRDSGQVGCGDGIELAEMLRVA